MIATYRVWGQGKWRILVFFMLFVAVAVALTIIGAVTSGPPWWFLALYWLAIGWNAYWYLLRIAYRLDLGDSTLRWEAPLRSATVRVSDVAEIRPQRVGGSWIAVIVLRDGAKIPVMARRGFRPFTDAIAQRAPGVRIRLSVLSRFSEIVPGPSSLRRPH